MKIIIVLAMHGSPPNDYPKHELAEFMSLHNRLAHSSTGESDKILERYYELDQKIRTWPRTTQNDRFYFGAQEIADALSKTVGQNVILGFNEFCAPKLDDALDLAVKQGAQKVIIITPMMTRGGEHAEKDIPEVINRAQIRYPHIKFEYAWPFKSNDVAEFLAKQINRFV